MSDHPVYIIAECHFRRSVARGDAAQSPVTRRARGATGRGRTTSEKPRPGVADGRLANVEEGEDEETLERVEDAEEEMHSGGATGGGNERKRPRQT